MTGHSSLVLHVDSSHLQGIYICLCVCACLCACVRAYACVHVCTEVCMCVYNYACVYVAMCLEKRAFYRLISGMHTSITIHLTAHYLQSGNPHIDSFNISLKCLLQIGSVSNDPVFGPNFEEFKKRFDPQKTTGQGFKPMPHNIVKLSTHLCRSSVA